MAYIGQAPTKVPLTSADITDGTIALADIAINQIDETLMKDAFVGDFSDVTVTAADAFLYGDATDSGNTKKDTIQGILDLASGGEDGLTNSSNTTWMTVSADEEVNMPLQPCFLAQRTSTVSNVTGNGGAYTIPFDVEIFDIGSNYATTGIFTAPITGKYIFTTFYYATGMASRTSIESQFVTSNRKHRMVTFNADDVGASSMVLGGSCIADMDASDTCYINLQCYSSSDTVDVYGDGSNGYTYFSGCLLV